VDLALVRLVGRIMADLQREDGNCEFSYDDVARARRACERIIRDEEIRRAIDAALAAERTPKAPTAGALAIVPSAEAAR
jgi:hypothetical protein